jgi:hypothetical protein
LKSCTPRKVRRRASHLLEHELEPLELQAGWEFMFKFKFMFKQGPIRACSSQKNRFPPKLTASSPNWGDVSCCVVNRRI